jgi:hypothetical protein
MRDVHAEEEVAKQSQGRKNDKSISTLAGMLAAAGRRLPRWRTLARNSQSSFPLIFTHACSN